MNADLTTVSAQELRRLRILRRRAQECRATRSASTGKTKRRSDLIACKEAERRLDSTLRILQPLETPGQERIKLAYSDEDSGKEEFLPATR